MGKVCLCNSTASVIYLNSDRFPILVYFNPNNFILTYMNQGIRNQIVKHLSDSLFVSHNRHSWFDISLYGKVLLFTNHMKLNQNVFSKFTDVYQLKIKYC